MKFEPLAKLVKEWISALRSGEYEQGQIYLKREINGKIKHCCLGVLCEIAKIPNYQTYNDFFEFDGWVGDPSKRQYAINILPDDISNHMGMLSPIGSYEKFDGEYTESLVSMNDKGKTFEEIADVIEDIYKRRGVI